MVGMLKLVQIKCTINSEPIIVCLERNFQADNIQPNEIINKNLKKLTMKKFYLLITWLSAFVYPFSFGQTTDSFIDNRDSTIYKTVTIGNQVWMAENLRYNIIGSWCPFHDSSYCKYGRYYTFEMAQKACPAGWYLPTLKDFEELTTYLGGVDVAGTALKAHTPWGNSNSTVFRSSGFSALPSGLLSCDGVLFGSGQSAFYWLVTENNSTSAYYFTLNSFCSSAYSSYYNKLAGFSVRCIKNN